MKDEKLSNAQKMDLKKQEAAFNQQVLTAELQYTGHITDEKLAILKSYGVNEQAMRVAAAKQDADMLRARLKMAADFHIKSGEQLAAFVAYTADASNAELKIFADKLQKQDSAATNLRNRLAQIYANPIIQNIVTVFTDSNMSIAERISKGADALTGLPKLLGQAAGAVRDYAREVGQIDTNFGKARDAILAAGSGIENAYDKTGAGGKKAAKEADKALKEQEQAVEDVKNKYEEMQISVSDSLFNMRQQHQEKIDGMKGKIDELKIKIDELNKKYTEDTGSANKSIAEKYVEQQQKVLDIQGQVEEANAALTEQQEKLQAAQAKSTGTEADQEQIQSIQDQIAEEQKKKQIIEENLAKEQGALNANVNIEKDYAEQVTEAKRRAGLTEFQRFLEDVQSKKDTLAAEYEEKKKQYEQDIIDQQAQIDAEVQLEKDKEQRIGEIRLQAAQDYETYMSNLEVQTKDGADEMVKQMNRVLTVLRDVATAKEQAGITQAQSVSPNGYASGGIVEGRTVGDSVPALLTPGEEVINKNDRGTLARQIEALMMAIKEGNSRPTVNQNITQYIGNNQSLRSAADEQFFAARVARYQ